MAQKTPNLSPARCAALAAAARRLNADPVAKAERMRKQMADPEFQRRRMEGYRKAIENNPNLVGRPRKTAPVVADNVRRADAVSDPVG
ncbi:MAG: hypothetical protein JOZ17_24640 [Acetobacteraceae bacterium]|nr:hypothetical protein [Acetobacteraceae bacterium]